MITAKAVYMLRERGLRPERLLMLTFSRDAAAHMKDELVRAMPEARDVKASTFHSFCFDFLRERREQTGIDDSYRVLDTTDAEFMLYRELEVDAGRVGNYIASIQKAKDLDLTESDYERYLRRLDARLQAYVPAGADLKEEAARADVRLKTLHLEPARNRAEKARLKEFIELYSEHRKYSRFLEVWKGYERLKAQKRLLDYGDMIRMVLEHAREGGEEDLAGLYDYVIVDEFQDTNRMQYALLKILFSRCGNITAVGDVDQAIYAFRGAYPENVDHFRDEFTPDMHTLVENYRSTDVILRTAHRLIRNNYGNPGEAKLLRSAAGVEGPKVSLARTLNPKEQARRVVEEAERLIREGTEPGQIAVLFRSYSSAQHLQSALERRDIPYQMAGSSGFLKRPEVRTALAYLYVIANLESPRYGADPLWWRLLHYRYGLSMRDSHVLSKAARKESVQNVLLGNLPAGLSADGRAKIERLTAKIEELRRNKNKTLSDLALDVYELSGLSREFTCDATRESRMALLSLRTLHDMVSTFEDFYGADLPGFVEYVEMLEELGDDMELPQLEKAEGIVLKTCHGAKGLEYDHVFVVDLAKDKFPILSGGREHLVPDELNDRYADVFELPEDEIEDALAERKRGVKLREERRLAYVAFTRARQALHLCYVKAYGESERPPSQFIAEACYDEGALSPDVSYVEDNEEKAGETSNDSDLDRKKNEIKKLILASIDAEPELALFHLLLYSQLSGRPLPDVPGAARAAEEAKAILASIGDGRPRGLRFDPGRNWFSYSSLRLYRECPKKYELAYLLKMPSRQDDGEGDDALSFGTFVHEALEEAALKKIRSREELDAIADALRKGNQDFRNVDMERARRIFDVFWARNKNTLSRSALVEQKFSFGLEGFQFTGKIDRIDLLNSANEVEIIDYKTGGEPGPAEREGQLSLYVMALEHDPALKAKGLVPKAVTLELLEQEKPRTFELNGDRVMVCVGGRCQPIDIEAARASLLETARKIAYDYEHGFPTLEECGNVGYTGSCPYRLYCPRWG
jgi:DNA helicase-2/ATP-dependent DNA helicase PcrA